MAADTSAHVHTVPRHVTLKLHTHGILLSLMCLRDRLPQLDPWLFKPLHESGDQLVTQLCQAVCPLEAGRNPVNVRPLQVLLDCSDDHYGPFVLRARILADQNVVQRSAVRGTDDAKCPGQLERRAAENHLGQQE